MAEWSYKLFALMNLTWDYVDTICSLCATMQLQETKPLVRVIRSLKTEYDRFRSPIMSRELENYETHHGLMLEEICSADLSKLTYGLNLETSKFGLNSDRKMLVIAVHQALTLMDAVKIYARWCDKQIASYDVWVCDCCMVQTEFMKLYGLIPQFAGDCYEPDLESRKITAGILVNRLKAIPLENILNKEEILTK